ATRVGWVGVDLFFVLSGFLITGILLRTKGRAGYFRTFYARRALRILPLYYGFLAFYLWVIPHAYPGQMQAYSVLHEHQAWLWAYGNNLMGPFTGVHLSFGLTHFWSLAVEEQFYLVWPLVVLLLSRRALLRTCVGLILAAPVLRVALLLGGVSGGSVYSLTFTRMDGLVVGAIVAALAAERGGVAALLPAARWVTGATAGVLLLLMVRVPGLHETGRLVQGVGYSALALFFGAVVVQCAAAREGSPFARAMSIPGLEFLGRHSYAIYVLHLPLLHFLLSSRATRGPVRELIVGTPAAGRIGFFFLAASLSVLVSWVVWHAWERPFLRLKDRVPYSSPSAERASWSSTRPSSSRTPATHTSTG
ncbi:MAG TPA: acyltransferase, partial [Longimicrobiaceae bacterium]|nr:acyltransferase [Longimicrobiaceae bacterium]